MAEFSEPELEAASPQVASREVLWSHFLRELRRYGQVRVDEGEVHLVVEGETVPHRFVATPDSLRQALVCGHALSMRHRPDVPPMQRLPVWFLTDLDEDIGSHEDPADEPYVKLDDFGELHRSARAEPPPLRAPREPPSRDGAVPGGHWSDSHGNRFDGGEDDQPRGTVARRRA